MTLHTKVAGGVLACVLAGLVCLSLLGPQGGFTAGRPQRAPHGPPPGRFMFAQGGRQLFPAYRLVALYGSPEYPALGALGEQPMAASLQRAKQLAAQYQPYVHEHVLPTLEIITTVASEFPTENGDYSQGIDPVTLQRWVLAARQAGVYVVLDLQSGRSDFLTQARQYEAALAQPNVGLALDPEWRLKPNEVPLQQIGSVDIQEINQTASWLSAFTASRRLPQKLFLLHQFETGMLPGREQLDTTATQLAYVIQMDGSGSQPQKQSTWQAITAMAPAGVRFGWKNFFALDQPMLDPAATMAVTPTPWYISYQ